MPTPPGQVGLGTTLNYAIGGGGSVNLANLIDITPGDMEVKIAEYQPMSSPTAARVKLAASLNTGDATFTVVHTDATVKTLQGMRQLNTISWTITLADGSSTEAFSGAVKKIGRKYKVDEVNMIDVVLAVSGDLDLG